MTRKTTVPAFFALVATIAPPIVVHAATRGGSAAERDYVGPLTGGELPCPERCGRKNPRSRGENEHPRQDSNLQPAG